MSANTREIITFQCGNYSNYVGTHWWNVQESEFVYDPNAPASHINHDVLFREGTNALGQVTYTPRLLLVDLKGTLKHLSVAGDLYVDDIEVDTLEDNCSTWSTPDVEVVKTDKTPKPQYQLDLAQGSQKGDYNFSETVTTWTDFMYSRYHPRSVNVIKDIEHSTSELAFDCFTWGTELWNTDYFQDNYSDKIRQYMEECNNCQGFQSIFDCSTGFSGLNAKCLEHLNDDYGKTYLAFPVFSPKSLHFPMADGPMSDSIRVINTALSYVHLIEHASLILPLSTMKHGWRHATEQRKFPHFNYKEHNLYETSSVLAAYVDTISQQYRLKSDTSNCSFLPGFCSDLTNYGRKLGAAALAMPFEMAVDEYLIDRLDRQDVKSIFTQLSPNSTIETDRIVQNISVRGIPETRLKRPLESAKDQIRMAAYKCDSVHEMFELYFQCNLYASLCHVSSIPYGMRTQTPFPVELFDKRISSNGFLNDFPMDESTGPSSIPMIATAQTSGDIANTIESLHREAARIKVAKIHRFRETGLESDDYLEMLNSLLAFKENYDDTYVL